MSKRKEIEISSYAAKDLLAACKELLEHASWMGVPIGYESKDFQAMFERADKAIATAEGSDES